MAQSTYLAFRKQRILVGSSGFIAGFLVGIPLTYLLYGWPINLTTFSAGLAGAALAMLLAERKRGLPTREETAAARFAEELKPLSLAPDEQILEGRGRRSRKG